MTDKLIHALAISAVTLTTWMTASVSHAERRPQVGIAGPEAFTAQAARSQLTSSRPLADVARCWKRDAHFIPIFSRFSGWSRPSPYVYRLTEGGRFYERITLSADAHGQAAAVIELSPLYDAGWSAMTEHDRLEPLRRCLGPSSTPDARAAADGLVP